MIWGSPSAFWLFLLLVPLAGLFFYRRRAVPVVVPSLFLWDLCTRTIVGGPFGRRFRRILTFILQAIVLSGFILALAAPRRATNNHDLTIVMDCSATMQTREPSGRTRLQDAVTVARQLVNDAEEGSRMSIVRAGVYPTALLYRVDGKQQVCAALEELNADDVDIDLCDAIRFAKSINGGNRDASVACISDYCGSDLDQMRASDPDLIFKQVGSESPNAGIVSVRSLRNAREIVIDIGCHGTQPTQSTLRVAVGDQVIYRQDMHLRSDRTEVRVPISMKAGDVFEVTLEPLDSLPLDNIAWGINPHANQVRIRLVSYGNVFLEQALRAQSSAEVEIVPPDSWRHDDKVDVTILDGPIKPDVAGMGGNFIVVSPRMAEDMANGPNNNSELPVTYWLAEHPVLPNADPTTWGMIRGPVRQVIPNGRVLVHSGERALLYEWSSSASATRPSSSSNPNTRSLVFNFDLMRSDLPFKPAFPVLLWDAIDYMSMIEQSGDTIARPTGSAISTRNSEDSGIQRLVCPDGQAREMMRCGDSLVWQDTRIQGVYTLQNGKSSRSFAFNWMSPRSAVAFVPFPSPVVQADAGAYIVVRWLTWPDLLLAVVIVGLLEWLIFHLRLLRMD